MNFPVYFYGLLAMLILAVATWVISLYHRDVSIVDSAWSLMLLAAAVVYLVMAPSLEMHSVLVVSLVAIWALRLSIHLTWRNWGEPEDRRYQVIREKYQPGFELKSLGIIFVFQAVLAWIISLPLWAALERAIEHEELFVLAGLLCLAGILFEAIADWQLAAFKTDPASQGKVMNTGLWRYTRHPNYFAECVIWWGFYLFALATGAWWSIFSPLLMTWLLLKFSGVSMLEDDIVSRRPAYDHYIKSTNAFIPGPVKAIG